MHTDFEDFMKQRESASTAFVNGDVKPLDELSTHADPATIFGPQGDAVQTAEAVNAANAKSASMFEDGSQNKFEGFHMAADGSVAYWTGLQHSSVKMAGKDEPVPMDLRVTEIFRREGDDWKLVHRHADPLKS